MNSLQILKGLYRHKPSGKLYNVLGTGRSVDNPAISIVIYQQQYESILRGTDIILPEGSLWTRSLEDFTNKFVKI